MEAVGLVLAIPGIVDLCLKYGRELIILCSSFKTAQAEISECLLRVAQSWVRLEEQLKNMTHIEPLMDERHRALYQRILTTVHLKLEIAASALHQVIDVKGEESQYELKVKRLKFAFKKDGLDRTLYDVETWMKNADLTWFLILRMSSPRIDSALTQAGSMITATTPSILSIRERMHRGIPSDGPGTFSATLSRTPQFLDQMQVSEIPMCNALFACTNTNSPISTFILNKIYWPLLSGCNDIKRVTRDLARKLQHKDPDTFGLLSCEGFVTKSVEAPSLEVSESTIIFGVPSGCSNPRSLRHCLVNNPPPDTLTHRLLLARDLAKSVGFIHTFGFVHKNVRPESILRFETSATSPQPVFLVGFEHFRKEEGVTQRLGDQTFEGNLYLHPDRQGTSPQERYIMQHDIYSLGVVLLEVGMWKSFVEHVSEDGSIRPTLLLGAPPAAEGLQLLRYVLFSAQDRFLSLARLELPKIMGTEYARVVETCLTCLDDNNNDFGDQSEFEDQDGIVVGARYIEKVILRLSMINM